MADKGDVAGATDQWQSRLTAYAKNQGFTVSAG
jgi:multiple sugar transport system substrate-binding protein